MGSKKKKKRYMLVTYNIKRDGKFDELVEFSKKKIGTGKLASCQVCIDMVEKKTIKCKLPGIPVHMEDENMPYENLYKHYAKWYQNAMTEFENS